MSTASKAACYIHAITTAVPQQCLDRRQTEALLRQSCINERSLKLLRRITRLTRIRKRHLAALDHQHNLEDGEGIYHSSQAQPSGPGMGVRTAMFDGSAAPLIERTLQALQPCDFSQITTLVTVSCTQAASPGLERAVFAHASLPPSVDRWNLGFMGCSAALAAVRLIRQAADSTIEALVVACELSSLHFQYTDRIDQMTANLLFADGAAALILSARPSAVRVRACRSVTLPGPADQMLWFAGDHGLQLQLSPQLPETLGSSLPEVVSEFLAAQDLTLSAIDHFAVHPGGPQILDSVAGSLALPDGALDLSREVLAEYGNMSSPTILFILKALFESRVTGRVLALAFGPGLTIELALLELTPTTSQNRNLG